jgi:hypothetical protein
MSNNGYWIGTREMSAPNKRWQGKLQDHFTQFLETLEDERVGWELNPGEFKHFLRQEFGGKVAESWDDLYQDLHPAPEEPEGVTENGPYFGAY